LVAHLAAGLPLWSIVRSEDDERVVVDREFLERVEDLTDVVIAFHQLVTELADARLAQELLRWEIRKVSHRERKVEEERLARRLLPLHEVDGLRN
jgi:hypothetical protein